MLTKNSLTLMLLLISVAFGYAAQAQSRRKVSLLVTYCDNNSRMCKVRHIERFNFINGDLVSRKRVVTLNQDVDGFAYKVLHNRYVLTTGQNKEKIFDLQTGKFIASLPEKFRERQQAELPGLVSPDGKKSVYTGSATIGSTGKLEIHFVGKPTVVVNESFKVSVKVISCVIPSLPLVWIDNTRILTQKRNGSLVIVSLDGTVSPFIELPCTSSDFPRLERSKSGKLVYTCSGDEYAIDVENKRFEKIKRDLGNGFSFDVTHSDDIYYYNDKEIGRNGSSAVSIKSYLALLYSEPGNGFINGGSIDTIEVWNETKQDWLKLKVDGWNADIIDWIEE